MEFLSLSRARWSDERELTRAQCGIVGGQCPSFNGYYNTANVRWRRSSASARWWPLG